MATVVSTNFASSELGAKDRIGSLDYIKSTSKLNRRYVGVGAEFNTGQYESKDVTIRDGRYMQEKFAINRTGFFLANHHSEVSILDLFTDLNRTDRPKRTRKRLFRYPWFKN